MTAGEEFRISLTLARLGQFGEALSLFDAAVLDWCGLMDTQVPRTQNDCLREMQLPNLDRM